MKVSVRGTASKTQIPFGNDKKGAAGLLHTEAKAAYLKVYRAGLQPAFSI